MLLRLGPACGPQVKIAPKDNRNFRAKDRMRVFAGQLSWEANMISEISNDRLFGFVLTAIFVSVLILNAMSY